jgi:hypothetical protein
MAVDGLQGGERRYEHNLKHTYQLGTDSFGDRALLDDFSNLAQSWQARVYWS